MFYVIKSQDIAVPMFKKRTAAGRTIQAFGFAGAVRVKGNFDKVFLAIRAGGHRKFEIRMTKSETILKIQNLNSQKVLKICIFVI